MSLEDTQDQRHSHTTSEGQRCSDTDPPFERDRWKACRQIDKWAWGFAMLLDSDTDP